MMHKTKNVQLVNILDQKKCSRTLERRTKGAPPGKNDDQQNVAHNMN